MVGLVAIAALSGLTVSVDTHPAGAAGASPAGALTVSPSSSLVDNETVSVVVTGASPGSTYVAVECDPSAFTLLAEGASPADACDARHNAVITVDAGGVATTDLQPQAVLTTSLGSSDCRTQQCFVAVESLHSTGGPALLLQNITFATDACSRPGSCRPPDDAWDPSLGGSTPADAPTNRGAGGATTANSGRPRAGRWAMPGRPFTTTVTAGRAGDLTPSDAVTGPYRSAFPAPVVPSVPVAGEGLLRLAMSAPHTSWGSLHPSAVVVDATLTDLTTAITVGTQQFVLFAGSSPFTYSGFTGPVTTADRYQVTVAAEPSHAGGGLSWPAGSTPPRVAVPDVELQVVDPTNPQYLAVAYAPVLFGRSTSALHDVPMLVDATATPAAAGATQLSYTYIWSHEDAGTGFVPFLEWGTWGRMTDIENAISFTVAADGSPSAATYLWGGEPATGFPDSQGALQEVDEPFTGQWDGHHPVLRDATGNNDFSTSGTTPFRFQLAPVPGPGAGQTRESVMDAHPFTYQVSGQEVGRWYGDISTDPRSPEPGDARQYATVDIDTTGSGVDSEAVELQLAGDPGWYASDFHSGYPANGTGHVRTVVKLPPGWQSRAITGVRVQVYPPSAAPSVAVDSFRVLALQPDWSLTDPPIPSPTVVAGATDIPPALDLTAISAAPGSVGPRRPVPSLRALVTDPLGQPLAGVPVMFTASGPGLTFTSCHCWLVTMGSRPSGVVDSGRARTTSATGPVSIAASTVDSAVPVVTYPIDVGGGGRPLTGLYRRSKTDRPGTGTSGSSGH